MMSETPQSWPLITRAIAMTGDPPEALSPTVRVRIGAESGDEYNLTLSLTGAIQLWGLLSQYSPIKAALSELPEPIRSCRADAFVPVIEVEIEPIATADAAKLASALSELTAGDEQFRFTIDDATGRAKLAGIEELQLDQKIEALRHSDRIELKVGSPQIVYRETIARRVDVDYTHKKLTGSAGEFARVKIAVEPNPLDTACSFRNQTSDGTLADEHIAGIEKGVDGALASGVLAGFPVIRLKVFLVDGRYHDVDSSALAFEIATRAALREAMLKGEPVLLEPVMRVAIVTPEDHAGAILKDLVSRRGQIEDRGRRWRGARLITAKVPAANLFGYAGSLRQITQGQAGHALQFDHYAPVPLRDDPPFRPAVAMRI
jgi:elongation factor G